jgi:hypothetical protein
MILANLRKLGPTLEREIAQMPIPDDIMITKFWAGNASAASAIGERTITLRLIEKRFGPIPGRAAQRIDEMSAPELKALALRVLEARNLEELFATA